MPIKTEYGDRTVENSRNLLNFIGERSKPSFASELQVRPPIIGKKANRLPN